MAKIYLGIYIDIHISKRMPYLHINKYVKLSVHKENIVI